MVFNFLFSNFYFNRIYSNELFFYLEFLVFLLRLFFMYLVVLRRFLQPPEGLRVLVSLNAARLGLRYLAVCLLLFF